MVASSAEVANSDDNSATCAHPECVNNLMHLLRLIRFACAGWIPGGRRLCPICSHRVWRFLPYGRGLVGVPKLLVALDVVGSDVDHFECPRCGAHDRERHLLLYLK